MIQDIPFSICNCDQFAGAACALNCTAYGPGLIGATVSTTTPNLFYILARDQFGNRIVDQTLTFQVGTLLNGLQTGAGVVEPMGEGVYNAQYLVKDHGELTITVSLDNEHISGSPFKLHNPG